MAHLYDERDPAVQTLIKQVVRTAKRMGKYIGICGQAPSDHPELCDMLVSEGMESISLNADRVISTILRVAQQEAAMGTKN